MTVTIFEPASCPFCSPDPTRLVFQNDLILGLWDAFPVSPGHALLITRRHVVDWYRATEGERSALTTAIANVRDLIDQELTKQGRPQPAGYNVGFNAGAAAGQTIFHLHIHIIPRYAGDTYDPRGGIRAVIPGKAAY